jgi:DNA polymerase I
MITFSNGGRLVQSVSELPDLSHAKRLYLDTETTSGSPKLDSLNPWHNCRIAGVAATKDDLPGSWYVPMRHISGNLPLKACLKWLADAVSTCEVWDNHNVKYDAHVCAADGAQFNGRLFCSLTHAKIIDSDRVTKGGYGLDVLSKDWLGEDISALDNRNKAFLQGCGKGTKDYGLIPTDWMAEYSCQDVITQRRLSKFLHDRCPEQCRRVWETETDLTSVLFDMEQYGMLVDPTELKVKEYYALQKMLRIEEELHGLTDLSLRPHVNEDCYELLCNRHGLPILGWTNDNEETRGPSFDKHVLASYLRHPLVMSNEQLCKAVSLILEYREVHTLHSFFIRPYQELHVNGVMHPSYNQAVRTGRMSCKKPNAQQLDEEAKSLIHSRGAILSMDYSQIEFRLIVHYIENARAIAAYADDPDTDFHDWVSKMCGIPRKPAKSVNFCMGYGGGKERVLSMLASNMELVGNLMEQAARVAAETDLTQEQVFVALCRRRAEEVFTEYHGLLPELKRTSRDAAFKLKSRGFVFNAHGRHRHLPEKAAFRAFNSVVQSDAADIMKERTVAVSPRFNKRVRDMGANIFASVHDETAFDIPLEAVEDPANLAYITNVLEASSVRYRVPIRVSCGVGKKSWADACAKTSARQVDRALATLA